jgi:hypothetical protein
LERKLFVHVGPPRTATTAIQSVMIDHDGSVVVYPKTAHTPAAGHSALVFSHLDDHRLRGREDIDILLDRIAAEASVSDRPVLISTEFFFLRPKAVDLIPKIAERLGIRQIEAIFVVREHFSQIGAFYRMVLNQARVKKIATIGPDEYLELRARRACIAPLARALQAIGVSVHMIPYKPSSDTVLRFLRYIGFSDENIPEIPISNVSVSVSKSIARLALNRAGIEGEARIESIEMQRLLARRSRHEFIFGLEAARKADEYFSVDREYLSREFGIVIQPPDLENTRSVFRLTRKQYDSLSRLVWGTDPEIKSYRRELRKFRIRRRRGSREGDLTDI